MDARPEIRLVARLLLGAAVLLAGCMAPGGHAAPPGAPASPAARSGPDTPAPSAPQLLVNSLGMRFVRVPAGEFLMGSDEAPERLARDHPALGPERFAALFDEAPVHSVRITRAFWLGQHEVTVGQFRRFLEASGHVPESVADGTGGYGYRPRPGTQTPPEGDAFEGRDPRWSWRDPGFPQGEDHPVLNVTWNDAVALAAWLSRQEGRRYRLPTEAEWEYACRAGSRTRYPAGDDPRELLRIANVFDRSSARDWPWWSAFAVDGDDGHAFTAPVGRFEPNAFGLHDMLGNAWEWVADWYDERYYAHSPTDDPPGPEDGSVRVRRGGSWHSWPLYARCSFRNWNSERTRYTLLGMRLLLEADDTAR